jgi:hypothetical protein
MAIMLGFLAFHEGNQERLLSALPGSSPLVRIDALIDTIRDFMNVSKDAQLKMENLLSRRKPDKEMGAELDELEANDDEAPDDDVVLMPLTGSLQGGQRDHESVNAVITLLEQLRSSLS